MSLHDLGWGPLVLGRDGGGYRHFLHGEPVSCGTGLLLQCARVPQPDPGEYGESDRDRRAYERDCALASAMQRERDAAPLRVRYESPLHEDDPPALLYTEVGGHEVIITARDWMRLRWPERTRR